MKNNVKAIIYDWDGTLCDSIPLAFKATQHIFQKFGVKPPTFETYVATFGPPYTNFYWANGLPTTVTEKTIWEIYLRESNGHDAKLFNDSYETICMQMTYGIKIGLVTGQRLSVIESLMQRNKCTGLFKTIHCEASPDKITAFKNACQDMDVSPSEACSVGDFATDMRDSKKAGITPIGIVRNGHDVSNILLEAGAERVIRNLSELIDFTR